MSERDRPEIPRHLAEGVPSAGALEEEIRRGYQVRLEAWERGIPESSLQNATVFRYVSVLRDLKAAFDRPDTRDEFGRAAVLPAGDTWARSERIAGAGSVYFVAQGELCEGLTRGSRLDDATFTHAIRAVVAPVGGLVQLDRSLGEHSPRSHAAPGLWNARLTADDYPSTGRQRLDAEKYPGWWVVPDAATERQDGEHLQELAAEARRQGLPQAVIHREPVVRATLTRLVYARHLAAATSDLSGLPEAPGLTPAALVRLERAAPLLDLSVKLLEEEFHPGRLSPAAVAGPLGELARRRGLKIV